MNLKAWAGKHANLISTGGITYKESTKMNDSFDAYVSFAVSDLGLAVEALAITLGNYAHDHADERFDDVLETVGTSLFRHAKSGDTTKAFTALLSVTRWAYEHDAMSPSMRLRLDEVARELNRL